MNASEAANFKLIETLLHTPEDGLFLLDGHLGRLAKSAAYFNFRLDERKAREALETAASVSSGSLKIRLLLSSNGVIEISSAPLGPPPQTKPLVRLHPVPVDSGDVFLRHKTTNRGRYDEALAQCAADGLYDFIFMNENGELTEGAWNNILIEKDGVLYTPPEECGLLPGVYRQLLLNEKKAALKILKTEDLSTADKIFFCNSVRRMVEVSVAKN